MIASWLDAGKGQISVFCAKGCMEKKKKYVLQVKGPLLSLPITNPTMWNLSMNVALTENHLYFTEHRNRQAGRTGAFSHKSFRKEGWLRTKAKCHGHAGVQAYPGFQQMRSGLPHKAVSLTFCPSNSTIQPINRGQLCACLGEHREQRIHTHHI